MASRKEQKEQLRREREEREAAAKATERRRRLIGYGAGGGVVAIAAVVLVVVLAAGGGGSGGGKSGGEDVLPGGGTVPTQKISDLKEAAKASGCELKDVKAKSRMHTGDLSEKITYATNPPTSGKHFEAPSDDGEYQKAPDPKQLVHAMEHGRVIVWFKKGLPKAERANLKALFDEDPYQLIITPDNTGMTYAVAATAWSRDPQPNGTGRLLGCPGVTPEAYDAIRAFKDEHRGNGPEDAP